VQDYNETTTSVSRTEADRELSWTKIKSQSVPDGHSRSIPVHLFSASRVCTTDGHKEQENWFARYSKHSQEKSSGGVTWDEWKSGLLIGRAENELEYVGSVKDVHKVFEYPTQNLKENLESTSDGFPVGAITTEILEVVHALPPPLSKRTFPVLAISSHLDEKSFTTVQIPVDHLEELVDGKGEKLKGGLHKKGVLARYVSIERVRLLDDGDIEWIMGTASDAGGVLPGFVQKLGIPGTIAKDVGWFVGWSLNGQPRKSQSGFD